jgi:hypothetical protein
MNDAQLARQYEASLLMCRMDRSGPPSAAYIQQLVQAWRELNRRKDAKHA